MSNAELIWDLVDEHREEFIGLADRIWGMPEICYTEYAPSRNTGRCWNSKASGLPRMSAAFRPP